jgi:phosphohistidine phosphatase
VKRLLLLRHAKAQREGSGGDAARPLADIGRADAALLGRFLAERRLVPDFVLCSPAQRTRETLEIVADALGAAPPAEFPDALYLAGPDTLLRLIRHSRDAVETLMAIGHNPGIEECAHALTGTANRFPTCTLAAIGFPIRRWREAAEGEGSLELFLRLKDLRAGA